MPAKALKATAPKASKPKAAKPKALKAVKPKTSKAAKPKAAKAAKPKAAKAAKPKAAKASKPKALKASKPKALKASKPKAAKASKPKASKASKVAAATSSQPAPHYTVWDGFDQGFSVGAAARWVHFEFGPFVANDGIASTSAEGLRVVAKGKNPTTGEPAYTLTLPPEQDATGVPGQFDHCKWLVYANHKASTGLPGFDAVRGQTLAFETWMSGQLFGTRGHPFGEAVQDPDDDLRLAMAGQNAIDLETGLVLDFLFTNKRLYAVYERLTFARTPQRNYAAFTYAIPVAERTPSTVHHTKIAYDRAAGVVRWLVDEKEVFKITRIGRRLDSKWLLAEHGGEEEDVEMRQLNCGFGLFTLLDAHGLVRLAGNPGYYHPPETRFVDEKSLPESRLFGQGAEIRLLRYAVSSSPNSP